MRILVAGDNVSQLSTVRAMLVQQCTVTSELLASMELRDNEIDAVVVAADLRLAENISALKRVSEQLGRIRKTRVPDRPKKSTFRRSGPCPSVRPTSCQILLSKPLLLAKLIDQVRPDFLSGEVCPARHWPSGPGRARPHRIDVPGRIRPGPKSMSATRKAPRAGLRTRAEDGLSDRLTTTVRQHHEGTYQHCLLVTGIAVHFGLSLGLGTLDLERLHSAAMFTTSARPEFRWRFWTSPATSKRRNAR